MTIAATHHDVAVCHQCAVVAANGDETAICDCQTYDEKLANACGSQSRTAAIELLTTDSPIGSIDHPGYWNCWVCSQTHIGAGHRYQINPY